jgi:hypothetical protein
MKLKTLKKSIALKNSQMSPADAEKFSVRIAQLLPEKETGELPFLQAYGCQSPLQLLKLLSQRNTEAKMNLSTKFLKNSPNNCIFLFKTNSNEMEVALLRSWQPNKQQLFSSWDRAQVLATSWQDWSDYLGRHFW